MTKTNFPHLQDFLRDSDKGLSFHGHIPMVQPILRNPPQLKYYTDSAAESIEHNQRWARGEESEPSIKFAYLMLPTVCNQKCMGCFTGQDKSRLPPELDGPFYSDKTTEEIIGFLREHGAEALVYSGGGELFTWKGAFDYIHKVTDSGLGIVIFTNGTLLQREDVERLADKDISLIISLRDTVEAEHNQAVGVKGFQKTLLTLEWALEYEMQKDNKLAVEIPVTRDNAQRVLYDFIPVIRALGVIPLAEEYIQIRTSIEEKKLCHTFSEARDFFRQAVIIDQRMGFRSPLQYGTRMLAQPQCQRPLYSFVIYPNGTIMDCPSNSVNYGNLKQQPLSEIIQTSMRKRILDFQYCPCSVFYTTNEKEIPQQPPSHLEALR